ncbi:MAG: tetratricopeptide repeat protein [Fimbriimonas sp.]
MGWLNRKGSQNPEELIQAGRAALDRRQWGEALRIAGVLHRLQNTGGFEIEARAEWEKGRRDRAIKVMRKGVETVPTHAPLWHFLGRFLSDSGEFDEAARAFEECRRYGGDPVITALDIAVIRQRQKRYGDALTILLSADLTQASPWQRWTVACLEAWLNCRLERYEEALELLRSLPDFDGGTPEEWASIDSSEAFALFYGRNDREGAGNAALRAYRRFRGDERALLVLRLVAPVQSPTTRHIQVGVGLPDEDGRLRPWAVTAAAEGVDAALELLRGLELDSARGEIQLIRGKVLDPCPDVLVGVYNCVPVGID